MNVNDQELEKLFVFKLARARCNYVPAKNEARIFVIEEITQPRPGAASKQHFCPEPLKRMCNLWKFHVVIKKTEAGIAVTG